MPIRFFPIVRQATRIFFAALLFLQCATTFANADEPPSDPIPDFAALEKSRAVIGKVRVLPQNIFDLADEKEDNWLFRYANKLHIQTNPRVIERALLFKTGERISQQKIAETERLLRNNRYLYDVTIRPGAFENGVVDIDVITRDTWTIDVGGSYSRSGGNNKSSIGIKDYNLLGTGVRVGFARIADADRKGSEFEIAYAQAFDGWTNLAYTQGKFDDGKRKAATVARPFYSLDTRWAGAANWSDEDRTDAIYNAGEIVAQYRHQVRIGDLSGGWSRGLVDGWTQRYSVGTLLRDDRYLVAPSKISPPLLPVNQNVRAAYARYELIEDQFVKLRNRDQIFRPEFFVLGFNGRLQLSRPLTEWGSTQSAWLYSAVFSQGFENRAKQDLLLTATLDRRIASTGGMLTQSGGAIRYFAPRGPSSLFYAAFSGDHISGGGVADQLLIGGNNGLRGFPSRYQAGKTRALVTIEQRVYTDWYPFRLFRVGGAAFADYGRAWGGLNQNTISSGWLADAGIGLRIALDRAAFANVLHLDLAVPLNRPAGIKSVQFLVKTELTF